jgi:hypothetical protein
MNRSRCRRSGSPAQTQHRNRNAGLPDPFLLLDHFASANPRDYEAGFPLHPHRGIETVTYVLRECITVTRLGTPKHRGRRYSMDDCRARHHA